MSYIISIIPKRNSLLDDFTFATRKLPAVKRVLGNKKVAQPSPAELVVNYKDKRSAFDAARDVRQYIHGATAKVYPRSKD